MRQDKNSGLESELFGSGIQSTPSGGESQLFADLGRALWRKRVLLGIIGFIGGVAGYAASYLIEVRFTAYSQVMIETRVANDQGFAAGISGLPTSLTALESELEVLRSADLVQRVVTRLDLVNDTEFVPPPEENQPLLSKEMVRDFLKAKLVEYGVLEAEAEAAEPEGVDEELAANTIAVRTAIDRRTVEQVGNVSAVYTIGFTSRNPQKAALLANTLAEEYVNRQIEEKLQSLERSQDWLTDRTEAVQLRLAELSVELENHLLETPFSGEDIQTKKVSRNSMEAEQLTLSGAVELADENIARITALIEDDPIAAAALIERPSPTLLSALAQDTSTDAALQTLSSALRFDLETLLTAQERRKQRVETLQAQLTVLADELVSQALHDARTRQIENDIRVNEAIYQDFVSQLSRRTQQDQFLDPDSRVISFARAPQFQSEPGRAKLAVLAAMAALSLVAGLIVLRELLQDRLRTVADYERVTGTPLIGIIPKTSRRNAPLKAFGSAGRRLKPSMVTFARKLYNSIVAEHRLHPKGRNLRGRLGDQASPAPKGTEADLPTVAGERGQVIVGVGTLPNEGISTMNLLVAATCGDAGERVVLLDCDFWKSPFKKLAVTDPVQYTDALFQHDYVDKVAVETSEVGVDIIAAPGNLNDPTALLLSSDFRNFIKYLTQRYDRVILDAPPLLKHIDTAALYRIADVVILGAAWNRTREGAVTTALKILSDVGVNPSAVVATRVNLRRASAYGDEVFQYARAIR